MNEIASLFGSMLAGTFVGLLFFGFLWLTIRHLPRSRHPLAVTMMSLFGRFGFGLGAFYLIARWGSWEHVLAGIAGFITIRMIMVRRLGPAESLDMGVSEGGRS